MEIEYIKLEIRKDNYIDGEKFTEISIGASNSNRHLTIQFKAKGSRGVLYSIEISANRRFRFRMRDLAATCTLL